MEFAAELFWSSFRGVLLRGWMAGVVLLTLCCCCRQAGAQAAPSLDQSTGSYRLALPVDEVVLTFHAADAQGLPVNDLKAGEMRLLDDGAAPRRIVAFDALVDRPIRAGILLDTSASMQRTLAGSKAIAGRFAQRQFRQASDQALVMNFAYFS